MTEFGCWRSTVMDAGCRSAPYSRSQVASRIADSFGLHGRTEYSLR